MFGAGDEGTSDGKSSGVGESAEDLWLAVLGRAGDAEEGCPSVELYPACGHADSINQSAARRVIIVSRAESVHPLLLTPAIPGHPESIFSSG